MASLHVGFVDGAGLLERLGQGLDELHEATGAPVTARRPWLRAWLSCDAGYDPFAVVVSGAGGRLEAAALLAASRRRLALTTDVVAIGHRMSDQVRLPARSEEAAAVLAHALAARLRELGPRWRLVVRNLPQGDLAAARIAAELPGAELVTGDVSPALRFRPDRSVRAHVSRNHHQQVRRMSNRMRRDGLQPEVAHLRDPAAIEAVLPEVRAVWLQRDVAQRGRSVVENERGAAFLRAVALEHARRGEVELTTLRLGGELAAYALVFLDGGTRRVWSCRMSPRWAGYGAGRVANHSALEHALADPRSTGFDWMRGEEPYKHSMSNTVVRTQDLLAWSAPALKALYDGPRRAKALAKSAGWLRPAIAAGKRLQADLRRGRRAVALSLRAPRA